MLSPELLVWPLLAWTRGLATYTLTSAPTTCSNLCLVALKQEVLFPHVLWQKSQRFTASSLLSCRPTLQIYPSEYDLGQLWVSFKDKMSLSVLDPWFDFFYKNSDTSSHCQVTSRDGKAQVFRALNERPLYCRPKEIILDPKGCCVPRVFFFFFTWCPQCILIWKVPIVMLMGVWFGNSRKGARWCHQLWKSLVL